MNVSSSSEKNVVLIPLNAEQAPAATPPGEYGLFNKIWNTAARYISGYKGMLHAVCKRQNHRDVVICETFHKTIVILNKAEYMRPFLEIPRFGDPRVTGGWNWRLVARELGEHNLVSESISVEDHRRLKTWLAPHFSASAHADHLKGLLEAAKELVLTWKRSGKPLNLKVCAQIMAQKALQDVLFGVNFDLNSHDISDSIQLRVALKYLGLFSPARVDGWFEKSKAEEEMALSLLLGYDAKGGILKALRQAQARKEISFEESKDMLRMLIVTGQMTSENFLQNCLLALVNEPGTQTAIQNELDEHNIKNTANLSLETIYKLRALNTLIWKVIKENPPARIQTRQAEQDLILKDNDKSVSYKIPKGALVTHFNLEEEDTENKALPFGYGFNACPGKTFALLQAKAFLIVLLSRSSLVETIRYTKNWYYRTYEVREVKIIDRE